MDIFGLLKTANETIEKNKGFLDELPATLHRWSELQIQMAHDLAATRATVEKIEIAVARLTILIDIGGVTPAMTSEALETAASDPRNAGD